MTIKWIIALVAKLHDSVPLIVLLLFIIVAETTYFIIDYYVVDLTPGIGTYYNGRLDNIEESLQVLMEQCVLP